MFGNQVYQEEFPQVEFIAQTNTRADFLTEGVKDLNDWKKNTPDFLVKAEARRASGKNSNGEPMTEGQKAFLTHLIKVNKEMLPDIGKTYPVPPTLTVEKGMTLHRGKRTINILYLGRGNTRGDLIVHLPQEKILITGDLLVNPVPLSFGSYLGDWVQTLKKLREMDADLIIPGHGPVQQNRKYLDLIVSLLESVLKQTQAAVKRGLSLEDTRKVVDLKSFRLRFAGNDPTRNAAFKAYFVTPAVERAYKEAKGELENQ